MAFTENDYMDMMNKQLEHYGKTIDQVKDEPEWFSKYTMTTSQYEAWRTYCINLIAKKLRISKKLAAKEFTWVNLQHGLRIQD